MIPKVWLSDSCNIELLFVDGDNPTPATLNPENEWTFSIIEPLFDFLKAQINNTNSTYDIFGHSAGAQFVHRLLLFKTNARINNTVVSASGWYTFPDTAVVFPYGFENSPLENLSLNGLFSKNLYVQVGENDNNPNDSSLRRNEMADAQGPNRKNRAVNFYQFSEQLAQAKLVVLTGILILSKMQLITIYWPLKMQQIYFIINNY